MDSTLLAMIEADPLCEAEPRRSPPRDLLRDLEWIRLTYGAGYDGQTFFHDKRFADRGPIIPDDPRYRGVSGYFDP